jgi:K+-sensing histidine kinase KdpD
MPSPRRGRACFRLPGLSPRKEGVLITPTNVAALCVTGITGLTAVFFAYLYTTKRQQLRQTWRRSEELRVLNEVGRALSSMLDTDELFEKIFTEIQRLFGSSSFYVALTDATDNQIHVELEVVDSVRLPKRVRPLGNHLTECILRTQEPVLIR